MINTKSTAKDQGKLFLWTHINAQLRLLAQV